MNPLPGLKTGVSGRVANPAKTYGLAGLCRKWPPLRSGRPFIPELKSSGFSGRFYKNFGLVGLPLPLETDRGPSLHGLSGADTGHEGSGDR